MPSLKAVLLGLMAASTTLAGPIVRPGSVDVRRTVAPRDSNMADSIAVSLPDPVMDEQEDQVATAKSELGDDESGGFEALQSRATQPRKGGTRISNGGRSRGRGTTTISTTNGLNIPQGTKLNPGILQAISPPPLFLSQKQQASNILAVLTCRTLAD
ncbi:hypothetical protein PspLS_01788 [Pyricularia sp. CBS 133598]|nr:hypothetical protein PspLS_01788 [Pyricularia sp. CBS 133598]